MKKAIIFLLATSACRLFGQYNLQNISVSKYQNYELQSGKWTVSDNQAQSAEELKYTFKNLRLYMLKGNAEIRKSSRNMGNYVSLQDAVAKSKIRITEMNGGSVNTLLFENISTDTILLLAGEIVTGGKQDRVVGSDLLLNPKGGQIEVPVFCVEHGRWTANGTGESFKGYFGVSAAAVRKQAVVDKNQSGVWKKVAEVTEKNKVSASTGTYTALSNSDSLNKEIISYMDFFTPLINEDTNIIGFVAVTGDSIIGCDLFANNSLFKSHAEGLVKASAVEATTNGSPVKIAAATVLAFLAEFLGTDKGQEERVGEKGTMLKSNNQKVHMNFYKSGKAAPIRSGRTDFIRN